MDIKTHLYCFNPFFIYILISSLGCNKRLLGVLSAWVIVFGMIEK